MLVLWIQREGISSPRNKQIHSNAYKCHHFEYFIRNITRALLYILIAGHNKSSTTLHRSMTSSTQALSLLCEMLACLLVQCPSKFLSPLRIQFKVMQKNACIKIRAYTNVILNVYLGNHFCINMIFPLHQIFQIRKR